jgi:predicted O-methyltransferase YrrM
MGTSMADAPIARYVGEGFVEETAVQRALRQETAKLPRAGMLLGIDPAAHLAWLARLIGARRTIEVGTFTGYSALAVALALPDDGRIVACDVSEEWTSIARRYWAQAGVAHKIDLRLGPAIGTLEALLSGGSAGTFDLAFVDADKPAYRVYYERCLALLRPGGVLVFDNMLWSGRVAAPGPMDDDTAALHEVNQQARRDPRVDASLLTVGDGLLCLRRR